MCPFVVRNRKNRKRAGADYFPEPMRLSSYGLFFSPSHLPKSGGCVIIIVVPNAEPWCRGLTCLPVTQETAGSNPVGSAIIYYLQGIAYIIHN